MPAPSRRAWILSASLLAVVACKSELDDKPAADPLADPWVDAIEDDPAFAAEPDPAAAEVAATAEPAAPSEVEPPILALAEAGEAAAEPQVAPAAEPAAGVLASPSATRSAALPGDAAVAQPAAEALAADPQAAPAEAPAPVAEPTPAAPVAEQPAEPAAPVAEPAAPAPITIADFNGSYRFVGGSAQRSDLEAAIETAAEGLPAAFRGIGRKRLTKTNPIDDTLDIVIAGDKVQTIFESGFDANCELDGPTIRWTSKKGDQYKVRVRGKGSKLVQIIEGEDGVKTTVFVLSADRKRLTVYHKIVAERLPEPMTYRLSYSRK